MVDGLETTGLELGAGPSRLLEILGNGLVMSIVMAELLVWFGVVARMEELGSVVLGQQAGVYIL